MKRLIFACIYQLNGSIYRKTDTPTKIAEIKLTNFKSEVVRVRADDVEGFSRIQGPCYLFVKGIAHQPIHDQEEILLKFHLDDCSTPFFECSVDSDDRHPIISGYFTTRLNVNRVFTDTAS